MRGKNSLISSCWTLVNTTRTPVNMSVDLTFNSNHFIYSFSVSNMLGISGQFLILSIFEIKTVQFVFNLLAKLWSNDQYTQHSWNSTLSLIDDFITLKFRCSLLLFLTQSCILSFIDSKCSRWFDKQEIIKQICLEQNSRAWAVIIIIHGHFRKWPAFCRIWIGFVYSLNSFARYVKFTKRFFFR